MNGAPNQRSRRLMLRRLAAPLAGAAAGTLLIGLPRGSGAQTDDAQPLRIVVPFGAGGIADLTVRAIAPALAERLGAQVIVENKPGAGGVVAAESVARAEPDARTLLLMSNANAVAVSLFKSLPFDVQRDFAPVGVIGSFGLAIVVSATSGIVDLAALRASAKATPGRLNIGTINIGSTQHLAAELFRTRAGLDLQVVPFNGTPAVLAALRGGHVDAAFEVVGPIVTQVQAGALRALAVTSAERAPALPDVPTVAQAGLPGFEVSSWNALAAPAKTPADRLARIHAALQFALARTDVAERLRALGVRASGQDGQALAQLLQSEIARWGGVIERARIEKQ